MRTVALVALSVLLAACSRERAEVRTEYLPSEVIRDPAKYYVPIPPKLVEKCRWTRDVLPSQALAAAKRRAECLDDYEGKLDSIDAVDGTPVPPESD